MSNKVLDAMALMFVGNYEEAIQELKNADMNRVKVLAMLLDCYLYTEQFNNAYIISLKILGKFSEDNLDETEYVYLEKARNTIKSYKNKFNMDRGKVHNKSSARDISEKEKINGYIDDGLMSEIEQSVKDMNSEVIEGEKSAESGIRITFEFDDEKVRKIYDNYETKQKEKKSLELVNVINNIEKSEILKLTTILENIKKNEILKLTTILENIKKNEILKLIRVLYNSNSELKVEIDNEYISNVLLAARKALNSGDFEKVIKLIKDNNLKDIMSQVLVADCYLMAGEFVTAVDNYERILNNYSRNELGEDEYEYLDKAEQAAEFYENIGFHEYDVYLKGKDVVQSVERSDESYPESDYYQSIINCKDKNKRSEMIEELFSENTLLDTEGKEKACFAMAEFYFGNDDFLKAFAYYYEAIKLNPNKALYYGYAANSLYKYVVKKQISGEAEAELVYVLSYRSSKFAKRAIELDPRNPRWHFYQSLALSSLIVHNPNFIRQSLKENEIALSLCRSDQVVLRHAILKSIDTVKNAMNLLDTFGALV